MRLIGGLVTAAMLALTAWLIVHAAARSIPSAQATALSMGAFVIGALLGFLCGSAMAGQASRKSRGVAAFSAVSGAVVGGLLGAAVMESLTITYLSAYASWPVDLSDQILMVAAFPVMAALGLCLGGLLGLVAGGAGGLLLRMTLRQSR